MCYCKMVLGLAILCIAMASNGIAGGHGITSPRPAAMGKKPANSLRVPDTKLRAVAKSGGPLGNPGVPVSINPQPLPPRVLKVLGR
jgi:hypothetical protein